MTDEPVRAHALHIAPLDGDGQPFPLADWQRAIDFDTARYAHYRPLVIQGLSSIALYREAMARAVGELADAAAIPRYVLDLAFSGEAYVTVPSHPDQAAFDSSPDRCWRCDASPAFDDIGLCPPCRDSLT